MLVAVVSVWGHFLTCWFLRGFKSRAVWTFSTNEIRPVTCARTFFLKFQFCLTADTHNRPAGTEVGGGGQSGCLPALIWPRVSVKRHQIRFYLSPNDAKSVYGSVINQQPIYILFWVAVGSLKSSGLWRRVLDEWWFRFFGSLITILSYRATGAFSL